MDKAMGQETTGLTPTGGTAHTPMRTCIATRQLHPRGQLLRIVARGEHPTRICPDPEAVMPGRGAWITPTHAAIATAEKRRAFQRALRISGGIDITAIREYVAAFSAAADDNDHERDRPLMSTR